jgi:hypothetical protein
VATAGALAPPQAASFDLLGICGAWESFEEGSRSSPVQFELSWIALRTVGVQLPAASADLADADAPATGSRTTAWEWRPCEAVYALDLAPMVLLGTRHDATQCRWAYSHPSS